MTNAIGAPRGNRNRVGKHTKTPRVRIDLSLSNGNGLRQALQAYMDANNIDGDLAEYARAETYRMWEERLHEFLPVAQNP